MFLFIQLLLKAFQVYLVQRYQNDSPTQFPHISHQTCWYESLLEKLVVLNALLDLAKLVQNITVYVSNIIWSLLLNFFNMLWSSWRILQAG